MNRVSLWFFVGAAASFISGCEPARSPVPVDLAGVRGIDVRGLELAGPVVSLTDGRWEEKPDADKGSAHRSVQLVEDLFLTGELTADGAEDGVAFVAESGLASGSNIYMLLIESDGDALKNSATVRIGDRVQIRAARLSQGVISLDLVQHSDTDPRCCPGDLVTRTWKWNDGLLEEGSILHTGRLRAEVLAGETWRLIAWNSDELVPDSIDITITYKDGSLAGRAGCNRYFSAVKQSDIPGDITVGIGGSTRMMCPPEVMVHEDRYLALLPKVTQLGFYNGRLFLGYLDDDGPRILLFARTTSAP